MGRCKDSLHLLSGIVEGGQRFEFDFQSSVFRGPGDIQDLGARRRATAGRRLLTALAVTVKRELSPGRVLIDTYKRTSV